MKRTNKHVKETAKPVQPPAYETPAAAIPRVAQESSSREKAEQDIGAFLLSTGISNPLSIALATGKVRPVLRPGRPRSNRERDAEIVRMKDDQGLTFGQIARKQNIGREVAMSAYYRMKRKPTR